MSEPQTALTTPWWKNKKTIILRIVVPAILGVIVFSAFIATAYTFHWSWTGLPSSHKTTTVTEVTRPSNTQKVTTTVEDQPGKTLWDWLPLLIQLLAALAIPIVVGVGTGFFTRQQAKTSEANVENQQQEELLRTYFDKMSDLLLDKEPSTDPKIQSLVRARTLAALHILNTERKAIVLRFLYDSGLLRFADLSRADLREVDLREADLSRADLREVDLRGAKLSEADLREADLSEANLSRADLRRAHLSGADLRRANLSGAIVSRATLGKADLSGADLSRAILSESDLEEAILIGAHLIGAHLSRARLREADLSRADLSRAVLSRAILSGAILSGATLSGADLSGAILSGADLSKAVLSRAILSGADLIGADLKGATGIPVEELEKQAKSLEAATLPHGEVHS